MAPVDYAKDFGILQSLNTYTMKGLEKELTATIQVIWANVQSTTLINDKWTGYVLQHTCCNTATSAQVLEICQLILQSSEIKWTLLRAAEKFCILEAILRTKSSQDKEASSWTKAQGTDIIKRVTRNLRKLDDALEEMKEQLTKLKEQINAEECNLKEMKKYIDSMKQRMEKIAPNLYLDNTEDVGPWPSDLPYSNDCLDASLSRTNIATSSHQSQKLPDKKKEDFKNATRSKDQLTDDEYLQRLIEQYQSSEDDKIAMDAETEILEENKENAAPTQPSHTVEDRAKVDVKTTEMESTKKEAQRRSDEHHVDTIPQKRVRREKSANVQQLRSDLADLEFGLEFLPRRKIGESSLGITPNIHCVFCGQEARHFSDSCPSLTNGDERWRFVRKNGLCQYCLGKCDRKKPCWNEKKMCWYCSVVKDTILHDLIPNDGGHHRALCNIPNSRNRILKRIERIQDELRLTNRRVAGV